jgi:excisionase family DNA binding protein
MSVAQVQAYTVAEVAKVFGVTPPTIAKWIQSGLLDEMRLTAGRIRLVSAASVERLKREKGGEAA